MKLTTSNITLIEKGAREAGKIIMSYYGEEEGEIERKADNSPITQADLASHHHLVAILQAIFKGIPIMSEENDESYNQNIIRNSATFWLIDPLDGTWSFI